MKFSIIIACYNLGKLVCKAIESCIHQRDISSNDYEIIVINDGSSDDTMSYINRYKDVSNLIIVDKSNEGLSQTRNVGLDMANGEYVLFLDGDDWYTQDALSTLSKYVDGYDVTIFPMYYYFSQNKITTNLIGLHQGEYDRNSFFKQTLGEKQFCIIPAPKKAYRRQFLLDNGIRFMEGILHEDNPFFIDVMNACNNVFYIDKPLYYYLQKREGSITSKHTLRNFNGVIAGIKHINHLKIERNPYVRFLNGNMLVFQAIMKYSDEKDMNIVFNTLRGLKYKRQMLLYLLTSKFDLKHFVRLSCLIIDPLLLRAIMKLS